MAKAPILAPHSVITANRLRDGAVVFLAADGAWRETIGDARIAAPADVPGLLEQAANDAARNHIVGPYATGITPTPAGPVPQRQRERIRATGPSVDLPLAQAEA